MPTAPFGPNLVTALKRPTQSGRLNARRGVIVKPRFFCCITGQEVGVAKDPVARLHLHPTRICSGQSINADICHSWAPVPVLAVLDHGYIDWGDFQATTFGPPWPCPRGPYNHTYNLDPWELYRMYEVRLVVFDDPVNAMGEDSQYIEVIMCDGYPGYKMYAGCEASGPWISFDAGRTWEAIGLDGVRVFDLDVSYYNSDEVWVATENGFFRTYNRGESWSITDPTTGLGAGVEAVSIMCSFYDEQEIYAISHRAATSEVWMHRTTDSGYTWTTVQLAGGCTEVQEINLAPGVGADVHQVAWFGQYMYLCATNAPAASNLYRRNYLTQTWVAVAGPVGISFQGIVAGNGFLWGVDNANDNLYRYDGSSWVITGNGGGVGNYDHLVILEDGTICVATTAATVDIYDQYGVFICHMNDPAPIVGSDLGKFHSYLLSYDSGTGFIYEYAPLGDWLTGDFVEDYEIPLCESYSHMVEHNGSVWMADASGDLHYRCGHDDWHIYSLPTGTTDTRTVCRSESTGVDPAKLLGVFYDGTAWVIYELLGATWVKRTCPLAAPTARTAFYDRGDYLYAPGGSAVNRVNVDAACKVHDDGRHHIRSMSADGSFIYVGLLNAANQPVMLRVDWDLAGMDVIYNPAAGTWGGAKADPNIAGRVWIFGDFGANVKVLLSEDWGTNWVITQDDDMRGAGNIVRPVLMSEYDPGDIWAYLNAATPQIFHSQNVGANWLTENAAAPFNVHCAVRSFEEDQDVFIGRVDAGALHLQFSPNRGAHLLERSTGFTPNAPVSSIVIVESD